MSNNYPICGRQMLENPSAVRSVPDTRPPRIRSAVSNGRRLFVEGDGNSAWSRRYRDLIVGHINDMGGEDVLSESEKSLIRRASAIECELEQMEGLLSRREPVDLDAFTRAAGHLRRILETLGLQRRARDVGPSLGDLMLADIEERRREAAEAKRAVRDVEAVSVPDSSAPISDVLRTADGPFSEGAG
jgi:hypothetical protein